MWYLNSGASNHITYDLEEFADLDKNIVGSVKFRDRVRVGIWGRGTVLFKFQNGEQRAVTGVYFIPRLLSKIVTIIQLDERGCKVLSEESSVPS